MMGVCCTGIGMVLTFVAGIGVGLLLPHWVSF